MMQKSRDRRLTDHHILGCQNRLDLGQRDIGLFRQQLAD